MVDEQELQSDVDLVRLLINDTNTDDPVFSTAEVESFLTIEGGNVKRAAAQATDTIADSEVLTSKVIKTQGGVSTDGAKVADALRKRATALREQADREDDLSDDGAFFEFVGTPARYPYGLLDGCP